jgi:hypothetical protein
MGGDLRLHSVRRLNELGRIRISATDVSQFIQLDQCERYLRLRSS